MSNHDDNHDNGFPTACAASPFVVEGEAGATAAGRRGPSSSAAGSRKAGRRASLVPAESYEQFKTDVAFRVAEHAANFPEDDPRPLTFANEPRRSPVSGLPLRNYEEIDSTFEAVARKLDMLPRMAAESFDQLCERLAADVLEDVERAHDAKQALEILGASREHRDLHVLLEAGLISWDEYAHARDFLSVQALSTMALFMLVKKKGLHLVTQSMLTALAWCDENMASWYALAVRQLFTEELRKDKGIRRQMIELTSHLTERQAHQVTGIPRTTIQNERRRVNAVETATVVERLTSLEARVAEVERQVGVLPDERVRDEVDAMLRSLDLGGMHLAEAA